MHVCLRKSATYENHVSNWQSGVGAVKQLGVNRSSGLFSGFHFHLDFETDNHLIFHGVN